MMCLRKMGEVWPLCILTLDRISRVHLGISPRGLHADIRLFTYLSRERQRQLPPKSHLMPYGTLKTNRTIRQNLNMLLLKTQQFSKGGQVDNLLVVRICTNDCVR